MNAPEATKDAAECDEAEANRIGSDYAPLDHLRAIMDAIGNTLICVSPVAQSEAKTKLAAQPAAFLITVSGGIPGMMLRLSEDGTSLGRSTESSFQLCDI